MLMVLAGIVTWSLVTHGMVTYFVVMKSTAEVVLVAASLGASVGSGAEKVVLSAEAEVPVPRTETRNM